MTRFEELDVVKIKKAMDIPDWKTPSRIYHLPAGYMGTIIVASASTTDEYEVEFPDPAQEEEGEISHWFSASVKAENLVLFKKCS